MSVRWVWIGLAASLGLTGCADFQEMKVEFRNRYLAKEAWNSLQETYGCMNHEKDFGRGFREGYHNVASGGPGCPPILPPRRYWSVRYMSMDGRARTEAWFAGFRYGALVAEQDGVGLFMELPTSLPSEDTRRKVPLPADLYEESEPGSTAPEVPPSPGEFVPPPLEEGVPPMQPVTEPDPMANPSPPSPAPPKPDAAPARTADQFAPNP